MPRIKLKFISRPEGQRPGGNCFIVATNYNANGEAYLTSHCVTIHELEHEVNQLKLGLDVILGKAKAKFLSARQAREKLVA